MDCWIERYGDWLGQRGLIKAAGETAKAKGAVGKRRLKYARGDGQKHKPVLKVIRDKAGLKAEFGEVDQKMKVKESGSRAGNRY